MGADIWIGRRGVDNIGSISFRDSFGRDVTLNALRLSYNGDLRPKLLRGEEFPLELNSWLLEELRARIAEYLDSPGAAEYAREYLEEAQMPKADPERMIDVWRDHIGGLIRLIEESSKRGIPLTMSF